MPNTRSSEPFVIKGWLTPQNDYSTQVFVIQVRENLCIKNNLSIRKTQKAKADKNHEAQTKNWHCYRNTVYQNIKTVSYTFVRDIKNLLYFHHHRQHREQYHHVLSHLLVLDYRYFREIHYQQRNRYRFSSIADQDNVQYFRVCIICTKPFQQQLQVPQDHCSVRVCNACHVIQTRILDRKAQINGHCFVSDVVQMHV